MRLYLVFIFIIFSQLFCDDYIISDYGFKSGLSLASQDFYISPQSEIYDILKGGKFRNRFGFVGGFFVEWFNEPYINLITELNYSQKGTIFDTGGVTKTIYNNRMDYLSLPILLKLKYPDIDYLPYFLFGFRCDYLFNRSIESEIIFYNNASSVNVGTSIGLGFEFNAGGFPLLIEYTYLNQYNKLIENKQYLYSARNVSHSFVLGYRLKDISLYNEKPIILDKKDYFTKDLKNEDLFVFDDLDAKQKKLKPRGFSRKTLLFRSLLLPGSAHFSTKRYYAGAVYSSLFAAALYLYINRIDAYNSQIDEWNANLKKINPNTLYYDYEQIKAKNNKLREEIKDSKDIVYYSLGTLIAIYLVNAVDAVIFAPENQLRIKSSVNDKKISLGLELDL